MAAAIQLDSESFEPTDEELATRAAKGDQDAFAAIYRRWSSRVMRFALARLRNREEAEDVVQEVFTALLKCLGSYRGESRFGTWLLGIAFHVICRQQRRRTRATFVALDEIEDLGEVAPTAEGSLDAARTLARCAELLASRTTPAQREIFWMHYGENRNTIEVAKKLRRSPETVRAQLCRARRALREATPGLAETLD
jgi:RNA polymerase sigma-70 factor, ECF subfamily